LFGRYILYSIHSCIPGVGRGGAGVCSVPWNRKVARSNLP